MLDGNIINYTLYVLNVCRHCDFYRLLFVAVEFVLIMRTEPECLTDQLLMVCFSADSSTGNGKLQGPLCAISPLIDEFYCAYLA